MTEEYKGLLLGGTCYDIDLVMDGGDDLYGGIEDFLSGYGMSEGIDTSKYELVGNYDDITPGRYISIRTKATGAITEIHLHSNIFTTDGDVHELRQQATAEGHRVITLFDRDYSYERLEIVLGRFLKPKQIVYARKCKVVGPMSFVNFMNENHRQGGGQRVNGYGLEYEGEIVGCITIGKTRNSRSDILAGNETYELLRLCFKKGVAVVGGTEKLYRYWVKSNPHLIGKRIITYSDATYNTGEVYDRLGFKKISEGSNSYYWVNPEINHWIFRSLCQKHKIYKAFGYDCDYKSVSEGGMMQDAGYLYTSVMNQIKYEMTIE